MKLYTYGYSGGGNLQDLRAYTDAGALILDIRFMPASRWNPLWNRKAMESSFAGAYEWCRALGNVNYKGGPIQLHQPGLGVVLLAAHLETRPVVLLCACSDWQGCHRRTVAELAQEWLPGLEVVHLAPGDRLSEGR